MGYKLGSFNMYKFQAYRSDEEIKKNLDNIANIICTEKFDIVAMQEILGETPMERILLRLGKKHWDGRQKSPNSKSQQTAEGYAFIWNTDRIGLAESVTTEGKRIFEPDIFKDYKTEKGQNRLIRDPFYGRFKPRYENFEIRLINTHIIFSAGSDNDNIDNIYASSLRTEDFLMRQNEFDILVKKVLPRVNQERYGNNLPAYTILMGDYNLNLDRIWTKSPYLQEFVEVKDGRYSYNYITVQDKLTTLKNRPKSNPDEPATGYANNYDHFTYDLDRVSEQLHPKAGVVDAVETYYDGDFEKYKKEVSDHIPIRLNIDLKGKR